MNEKPVSLYVRIVGHGIDIQIHAADEIDMEIVRMALAMADRRRVNMQSALAEKVCQQPQAHPARCGCEQVEP